MDDFTPFNTGAFVPFTGFDNRKIIITEFGQFSGNHFFLKKNAEISGCPLDDFSCKMRFLSSIKSNIIIIAKERQLDFYSYYLHAVYGISWTMKSRSEKLYGDSYFWLP